MEKEKQKICSLCGKVIEGYPAISRKDNKTEICSECGQREALEAFTKYNGNKTEKEEGVK